MHDDSITRRLAYTKSLYLISKDQYHKNSEIEISRSILSLDNSIESFFWIILEIKKPILDMKNTQFLPLLNEIKIISSELDVNTLKQMHIVRNKIQHNGILSSKSMADRFFKSAENMFENLSKEHLDINWNDISLANLIQNKKMSKMCRTAEQLFNQSDNLNAVKYLIMTFEVCKSKRQLSQFGSNMMTKQVSAKVFSDELPKIKPLFEYIDKINEETEIFKLGIDYMRWREYRLLLGIFSPFEMLYDDHDFKKEFKINKKMILFDQKTPSDQIVNWFQQNFSFVVESIIKWESDAQESSFALPLDTDD